MSKVYFIKPVGMNGPIKVGCSASPEHRRSALDTWSPFALEIVAEIEGDFDLEHRFHALFVETHQRREWFGWSRRIAAVIAAINDGTFDVSTLPAPMHVSTNTRTGKGSRQSEWNPARRFSISYFKRLNALAKRGMPVGGSPYFSYYAYRDGDWDERYVPDGDPIAHIRRCESFADEMTARYGHAGMKPVRWQGPMPATDAHGAKARAA